MNNVVVLQVVTFVVLGMMLDSLVILELYKNKRRRLDREISYSLTSKIPKQIEHMSDLIEISDKSCLHQLRLSRNAFGKLVIILKQMGGLVDTRSTSVSEQVAIFLSVLGHHKKNRVVYFDFKRSARHVSIHFHNVLTAVLKLWKIFVVTPEPVHANSTDERWKWFKGCLGALDGTYIHATVSDGEKPRYRSRKGIVSINVLGVCDRNMNFIYVLTGWEGSAADGRVLRDAVERQDGFKIPKGNYYLVDAGYTNGEGFLAPYRGVRYHLKEWGAGMSRPQNAKELYNMRHSKARNCIERAFGILKKRWAILRSQNFYNIETQNDIIMACTLLHNFIRREMVIDPIELELRNVVFEDTHNNIDYIPHVATSQHWTGWRDTLAADMFRTYRR